MNPERPPIRWHMRYDSDATQAVTDQAQTYFWSLNRSSPDTTQPYFLDLINRIDAATEAPNGP